ncbi:MAG: FAD-dependent oxidoreductase [Bradymonadaceae bacterium]|nr:FAD-dependent oxidoreductase [Lujinxingiaceae bacterium]
MNHLADIDCALIGAGAAGISAAIWLDALRVPFAWLSSDGKLGGTLARVHNPITNYPPAHYDDGLALIEGLAAHLKRKSIALPEAAQVQAIVAGDLGCELQLAGRPARVARLVILATGTRYRLLGVPGEAEGLGAHVSQSAMADAPRFANRAVAVVGGGDAGFENALHLARHGCTVHMLLRNDQIKARKAFVVEALAHRHIVVHPRPTTIERIVSLTTGCRLKLATPNGHRDLDVACLFVRVGVEPVLPSITPDLAFSAGYVCVDARQHTSHPNILAIGDITTNPLRSVATAVAAGAVAARQAADILGIY